MGDGGLSGATLTTHLDADVEVGGEDGPEERAVRGQPRRQRAGALRCGLVVSAVVLGGAVSFDGQNAQWKD